MEKKVNYKLFIIKKLIIKKLPFLLLIICFYKEQDYRIP